MFAFGLGIASMMLVIALAGRQVMIRIRGRLMRAGSGGRRLLGALLVAAAILIGTGLDRVVEGAIVTASPDWLIAASTAI